MTLRLLWATALCICGASAGILPASTQVFIPAASPTPFIYLDQPQQHETLAAHPPLTYHLSLAYPGAPTVAAPIATSATLTGIGGASVVTESVTSRGGDRISTSGLERTSGIERQRELQQQQQQIQQQQQQLREQQQQQQLQQQGHQRQRFEYNINNEVGRREGVDSLRQSQNQQHQQFQQQRQHQQQQHFSQQLQQQQPQFRQENQRFDYGVEEDTFGTISRDNRPDTTDVSNLDLPRHGETMQGRNRASFLTEQHGISREDQAMETNVNRRPDISSLTLSLQRQGHGSFSTGAGRSQIPGSLSIQRQQSQTAQRIAFQGYPSVDSETARYQQRQREQQAAAARVAGTASAAFEEANVRAFPTVLPTLAPTVAAVTAHGLQQPHSTDSGFSSYSVRFVSPQYGYGYYGDQHSLQQQSRILVRSNLDGSLASNAVSASGDIVGNH